MAQNELAPIQKITPEDGKKLRRDFNYIQCGVSGDIAVKLEGGDPVIISSALLDKMSIVPVGTMDEVLATGTTASDIYVW